MRFLDKILRNGLGMTTMEMVVAGGLVGAASLGVASLLKSMGGSSRDAEIVVERTQFASAMGVFLNSANGCMGFRQGVVIADAEQPYQTNDWTGLDGKLKEFKVDGFKNFRSLMDMRYNNIKSLTSQKSDVLGVSAVTLKEGGALKTLKKAVVKIKLVMTEKSTERDPVKKRQFEDNFPESRFEYNIPVLVNTANDQIETCGDTSTLAEACYTLKGTFNNDDGKCELPVSCESYGSYAYVDCNPKYGGVSCADYSHGTPFTNPVTGAYSCPAGSSALSTGGEAWFRMVSCGKKCEARVNFSIGFYSCLKCL